MNVELIDYMGSDLSVVNAARVSFAKKSELEWVEKKNSSTLYEQTLKEKDKKLINYLAKHDHWSPFGHASLQFHIKAPIFVARQLVKHQVGLVWNEVSRRYDDEDPEFFVPFLWREKHENKKQGSTDTEVQYDIMPIIKMSKLMYQEMLDKNIAPELARMILPQCMMTEWIWSGTLYAFARVCNLRNKDDAQKETREVTRDIAHHMKDQFPMSSKYLLDKE